MGFSLDVVSRGVLALAASMLAACASAPPKTVMVTPVLTPLPSASAAADGQGQPVPASAAGAMGLTETEPTGETPLATLPPPETPTEPAAPAGATATASATNAARVLLVDELPHYPVHLHAHDAEHPERAERHRGKHGRGNRPYHPAPGIIVDVVDAQGALSAADVQRDARNLGYWPFRQCYEDGLRRDQHLSGKVPLELDVSPSGAIDRAAVPGAAANGGLHDEVVAACVAREARHLALAASPAPTTVHLAVTLATGDEPVQTPKPVPRADVLREALHASWDAVQRCYQTELASHPDAGGRLDLRFRALRSEGRDVHDANDVSEVSEGESRFGDVAVTRCVLAIYRTAKLPAVHLPHDGSFVYSLHFEAKPEAAP